MTVDRKDARPRFRPPWIVTLLALTTIVISPIGRSDGSPAPKAELLYVGEKAFEPTLGFTANGDLFYQSFVPRLNDDIKVFPTGAVFRSRDLGRTWTEVSPSPGGINRHGASFDPYLYVDPDTSRIFTADFQLPSCAEISFSDDGGKTWTTTAGGCLLEDHQTLFAGPPVFSETSGYPNVVYYCAATAGALSVVSSATGCQKSLDGGVTWLPVGIAFHDDPGMGDGHLKVPGKCDGATGHGFVGEDGVVYMPKGHCGQPWIGISRDEGLTWQRVQVASIGMAYGDGGALDQEGGVFSHEAAVQADAEGNLYYTWVARDLLPYLAVSRDGGRTWGKPIRISPAAVREASLPNIVVGKPGRLAIAYMASTNAPGAPRPGFPECLLGSDVDCPSTAERYKDATWNGYVTMTVTALQPNPQFHTAVAGSAEDPLVKGPCGQLRCGNTGDFFDVVIGPDGAPWAAFVDDCLPSGCPQGLLLGQGVVAHVVGGPPLA